MRLRLLKFPLPISSIVGFYHEINAWNLLNNKNVKYMNNAAIIGKIEES